MNSRGRFLLRGSNTLSRLAQVSLLLMMLAVGYAEDDSVAVKVVVDTVIVEQSDSVITLSHGLVIRGSERLFMGACRFSIMSWKRWVEQFVSISSLRRQPL